MVNKQKHSIDSVEAFGFLVLGDLVVGGGTVAFSLYVLHNPTIAGFAILGIVAVLFFALVRAF